MDQTGFNNGLFDPCVVPEEARGPLGGGYIPELDDRLDTTSMRAFIDTPMFNRPGAEESWKYYLGESIEPGSPDVSPYAAPARAIDLSGLPPTYISAMEFDIAEEPMAICKPATEAAWHSRAQ